MKKSNIIIAVVVIAIIIIGLYAFMKPAPSTSTNTISPAAAAAAAAGNNAPTVSAPVTQTAAVSSTLSKYQNDELGFTVQYPTAWAVQENSVGPVFTIPVESRVATISTLNSSIYVAPGKCAFPPVSPSSIKENTTVKVGSLSFGMISVATTSKSLTYFNRMYTLQQGTNANPLCYLFSFAAITKSANSVNQPIITAADNAFSAMVKSFAVVTGPAGDSEAAHATGK